MTGSVSSFKNSENQTAPFLYYANNSLPIFILPALALNFIRNRKSFSQKELTRFIRAMFYITKIEYFLPWNTKDINEIARKILSVFEEKNLVRTGKNSLFQTSDEGSKEEIVSDELASLGTDFIKCLHVIGIFLHSGKNTTAGQFKKLITALSLTEELSPKLDLSLLNDRGLKIFDLIHELAQENVNNEKRHFEIQLNDLLMATRAATDKKFQTIIERKVIQIQIPR